MANVSESQHSWWEAFTIYRHPRVIGMLFLGFSAGLPLVLVFATLSAWLRDFGVSKTAIGFFSWVALTYAFKVLWSPIVDQVRIPILYRLLGRRRSWMVVCICGVAAGLVGMTFVPLEPVPLVAGSEASRDAALNGLAALEAGVWPVAGGTTNVSLPSHLDVLLLMALLAFVVAFSSATQDIAIDAYRIEAVDLDLQGGMAGTYQAGYMLAVRIVGGAFALYIADWFDWRTSYLVMAACMTVGFITVMMIKEPDISHSREAERPKAAQRDTAPLPARLAASMRSAASWFIQAIIEPFVDFLARNGRVGLVILVFIALFRLSDITLGVMAYPFYIDMGFSLTDIANATKVLGLVVTIVGAGFGGLLVYRIGVMPTLFIAAVLLMLTNLLFAWMAWLGSNEFWVIAVAVSADNFAFGISGSAFIAYLSSLTSISYTATQYALFTSLMLLPGKLLAGFSGVIVDAAGYVIFFLYASSLGIPAILLVLVLMYLERTGHLARAQAAAGAGE